MVKKIYYEINVYKVIEDEKVYGTSTIKEQILHLKKLEEPNIVQLIQAACTKSEDHDE